MSKNKFGLVFRMESEGAGNVEEVTADSTLAAEVGVAEANEEVQSATGDVTEVMTGIENATEASDELADVQGSLEEAVESGEGVSPREAEHLQARLEGIANLLGTTTENMGVSFRRESFGGTNSRLAATKMRLEFIKGWGAKIWELIKKAWEWVKTTVSNLLTAVTGSAERLEERLKGLQSQVADAKKAGKTIGTSKIKKSASVFSIDGTTSAGTVEKFLQNGAAYAAIIGDVAKLVAPGTKENAGVTAEDVQAHAKAVAGQFDKGVTASNLPKGSPEGARGLILLPGNKAVIAAPKKSKSGETEIEVEEVTVGQASEKAAEDYAPLTFEEMNKVLTVAIGGVGDLKKFQKVQKDLDAVTKANISHAEAMIKHSTSAMTKAADDEATKEAYAKGGQALKAKHSLNVKAVDVSAKHMAAACFAVLSGVGDVVAASLSSAGAAEAK